jgi:electron transport complex protein RnfG
MDTPTEPPRGPSGRRAIARSAFALAVIGAAFTLALFALKDAAKERIALNQENWIKQPLYALLNGVEFDNDPLTDRISLAARDLLGTSAPAVVYRVRRDGEPIAVVIRTIAPDGYQGPIELLVGIARDGTLLGVEVLSHNETPGLGDAFETREADWLDAFKGLSLENPPQHRWTVRKDGGAFDAFTGATITPRAIVRGVRRALEFYRAHRDRLFDAPQEAR